MTRFYRYIPRRQRGLRFQRVGEIPPPVRPDTPERVRPLPGQDDRIITFRRGLGLARRPSERDELEARAVSRDKVLGTVEERILYLTLLKLRIPFDFQSIQEGARQEIGNLRVDFALLDRPLVILVQGTIWHTGTFAETRDKVARDLLVRRGWEVVELWDFVVHSEPRYERWVDTYLRVPPTGVQPPDAARLRGERAR